MSLYNSNDITLLQNNWDKIMEEVEKERYLIIEPTKEEIIKVHNIICDFVKENKRKIYGGFGLNLLLKEKAPQDMIYKEGQIADVDFYSPEPIIDLMKLCNILQEKGFKLISGKEAQHVETYNINVNFLTYCDITYVPKNIYNKMPYKEIDGYTVIHPHFMWIDYLRMFTDPLTSYWRMNNDLKSFRRFFLLQKYFEFPYNKYPIEIEGSSSSLDRVLKEIYNFVLNRQTIILIGFYAYNYFLNESGYKKFKLLQIPYFEIISTNFRVDCLQLLADLNKIMTIDTSKITNTEFYPFFQFTDHSVEIYYDGDLVARIYDHNKKCIPYHDTPAIDFTKAGEKEIVKSKTDFVRMATFQTVLMYSIISIMRARVQNNEDDKNLYYAMTSHLIEMRKHYFNKTKKNMLDNTIFKEFEAKCIGTTLPADRQRRLIIESRRKKGKRGMYSYEPGEGIKQPETTYQFSNSSGNKIINSKHLKLSNIANEEDPEGDFDEDEKINFSNEQFQKRIDTENQKNDK